MDPDDFLKARLLEKQRAARFKLLGTVLLILPFAAISAVYGWWVFMKLWLWFVVPVTGTPPISFWQAAGLSVAFCFFRGDLPTRTQVQNILERQKGAEADPVPESLTLVVQSFTWIAVAHLFGLALSYLV